MNNQWSLKKVTKDDKEGMMKNSTIQGNTRKKALIVPYRTLLSLTEFLVFGSVLFINDVITFQEQGGVVQKMMTGWHNHQGVSETRKTDGFICGLPLNQEQSRKHQLKQSNFYQAGTASMGGYSSKKSLFFLIIAITRYFKIPYIFPHFCYLMLIDVTFMK